jgi:hypothetical protein
VPIPQRHREKLPKMVVERNVYINLLNIAKVSSLHLNTLTDFAGKKKKQELAAGNSVQRIPQKGVQ